jgi:sialate O-acetylesterase
MASIRSLVLFVGIFSFVTARSEIKLPQIFRDNMVLQRDTPLRIYGWASPGEKVTVTLSGRSASVTTDQSGKWKIILPALPAGGPYELKVSGNNSVTLKDVLLGDVWICSGQSNMQWPINDTGFNEVDTAFLENGQVRLFTVDLDMDYLPKEDIKGGNGWNKLSKDNIKWFSAVAYHFGKSLNKQLDVPIGLVSVNLGATTIETWMSNESLLKFPQFRSDIEPVVKRNKNYAQLNADFEKTRESWFKKYYFKGIGVEQQWYRPETDVSQWKPINASGNTWVDEPELKDHDGAAWFRTTFDLPANFNGKTFHIGMSQIDDYDIAWVNGEKVGENFGNYNHHGYDVSANLLKPKGNVLVVRVFDVGGIGGFVTHPFWANDIIRGQWIYRKGESINAKKFPKPDFPNATPFSSPSVLFNGNIAPLTQMAIKGAIWYQGEANVDRAEEYLNLFPEMITDWRRRWDVGDFPFVFVQLANYQEESKEPVGSNWAELREAQASVLTSLPNTAMASAIDIGEAGDIHPKNKQDVGKRLALAATNNAPGPTFKEMKINNDRIIVSYQTPGVVTKDKYGFARGFQIAGDDRKFYWAKAILIDDKVEVWSEKVAKPVAVRYAWDNNPGPLDLYNKEGLPALPFRSDNWPRITKGQVFKSGEPRF